MLLVHADLILNVWTIEAWPHLLISITGKIYKGSFNTCMQHAILRESQNPTTCDGRIHLFIHVFTHTHPKREVCIIKTKHSINVWGPPFIIFYYFKSFSLSRRLLNASKCNKANGGGQGLASIPLVFLFCQNVSYEHTLLPKCAEHSMLTYLPICIILFLFPPCLWANRHGSLLPICPCRPIW